MTSKRPRFLRSDSARHSRLGKNRPKLLKWRRPRGRHSKIRRHRVGYPVSPTMGYKSPKSLSGTIQGKVPVLVHTLRELEMVKADQIIILARVGAKKKVDLVKRAQEKNIPIQNLGGKK